MEIKKSSLNKRIMAYAIDFIILVVVTSFISGLIPQNDKIIQINKDIDTLTSDLIANKIEYQEYFDKYVSLTYEFDKENIKMNICNVIFILGYFVMVPLYNDGQTLGKKALKIKIVKNNDKKLMISDLLIRNFITTSLFHLLIISMLVYIIPKSYYFSLSSILGFMQIILVITTIFMILYRKDKRGIQDLLTDTSVIEVEK